MKQLVLILSILFGIFSICVGISTTDSPTTSNPSNDVATTPAGVAAAITSEAPGVGSITSEAPGVAAGGGGDATTQAAVVGEETSTDPVNDTTIGTAKNATTKKPYDYGEKVQAQNESSTSAPPTTTESFRWLFKHLDDWPPPPEEAPNALNYAIAFLLVIGLMFVIFFLMDLPTCYKSAFYWRIKADKLEAKIARLETERRKRQEAAYSSPELPPYSPGGHVNGGYDPLPPPDAGPKEPIFISDGLE